MAHELQASAIRMAVKGWPVFPCRPGEKEPAVKEGLKEGTTELEQILYWWGKIPACNIGVCTGAKSGFVVLDVDGDDGAESLRKLEGEHGALPKTLSIRTPSGGQHYYFQHPGEEFRNSIGKVGFKLDIRGDGGYVLAPPSQVKGRAYEVDERSSIAPIPEWLHELSQRHLNGGEAQPSSEWLDMLTKGVQQGGRNHQMARLVGHFLRRYVDLELTRLVVHLVNRTKFMPPLPEWEVNRTVDSVYQSELRRREKADA